MHGSHKSSHLKEQYILQLISGSDAEINVTVPKYPKRLGLEKVLGCHALFVLHALTTSRLTKRKCKLLILSILERLETKMNNFPIKPSSSSYGIHLATFKLWENPSEVRCIT